MYLIDNNALVMLKIYAIRNIGKVQIFDYKYKTYDGKQIEKR